MQKKPSVATCNVFYQICEAQDCLFKRIDVKTTHVDLLRVRYNVLEHRP